MLKPNSITLAGLKLVRDQVRTSFEPASVMEFGFYDAIRQDAGVSQDIHKTHCCVQCRQCLSDSSSVFIHRHVEVDRFALFAVQTASMLVYSRRTRVVTR